MTEISHEKMNRVGGTGRLPLELAILKIKTHILLNCNTRETMVPAVCLWSAIPSSKIDLKGA